MAPSDGIIAAVAGDHEQREAAYQQLAALARGDNSAVAATIASASVHIDGLGGELQDEKKLAEAFGKFGTVLAATLERSGTGALLTYDEVSAAQKAIDGASSLVGASGLAVDAQQAASRAGAATETARKHQLDVAATIAAACVGPLMETVFAADVSVVSASEFQRASAVLAEVTMLDAFKLGVEALQNERYCLAWKTPGNAVNSMYQKDPSELDRGDAMTVSWDHCFPVLQQTIGWEALFDASGVGAAEYLFEKLFVYNKTLAGQAVESEAFLIRLSEECLGLLRDPQDCSDLLLAGAWMTIGWASSGKLPVSVALVEADVVGVAAAYLQQSSPSEWISGKTTIGVLVHGLMAFLWGVAGAAELPMNRTVLLMEKGIVDFCLAGLKVHNIPNPRA